MLGESGALEPDEKYIKLFKREALKMLQATTDEIRMLPGISIVLDGHGYPGVMPKYMFVEGDEAAAEELERLYQLKFDLQQECAETLGRVK
eukprot:1603319-Amphidinium_carterae.1